MKNYLAVFLLAFTPSFNLFADTVQLKSGDTLTGKIKLIDGDKLLLETDFAGTITINTDKVKTFAMDAPVTVKQGLFAQSHQADKIVATNSNQIELINGSNATTLPMANNLTILPVKTAKLDLSDFIINGFLNAGAYYNKGNSKSEQYSLNGNMTMRYDLWRHTGDANIFRSRSDGDTSSYYYTLQYDVDRFFTPSFFWKSNIHYGHDWIEDIKTSKSINTGPGWQVWDNELSSLSLATLLGYQRLDYRNGDDASQLLGTLRWDYNHYFLGKTIDLFTNGTVGRSFNDNVDLDLSATAGLAYRLSSQISLNTSFTKANKKTTNGNSNNTNYNIGVGVNW
ncbi:DUF481 domain-containing protein [Orbaceae bacterium ac157xtp]